ncbi:MAG TPA: MurT ligase domain-containing protein [Streptosporangiaceae bacterium]|nr:MurT ligase domain-containing protein [Streptosporangiaceae bacterium]
MTVSSAGRAQLGAGASARRALAVSAGKAARRATRRFGNTAGTTLPGMVTLAIDPGALAGLLAEIPQGPVLVTGSAGKGTTCRMLARIMRASGLHPMPSAGGANQRAGLATTMVAHSALTGHLPPDALAIGLFEVDPGSFPDVLPEVSQPKAVVVTNIFADQFDRYLGPAHIRKLLGQAIQTLPADTPLVLNADDPRVGFLAPEAGNPRLYFGIDDPALCRGEADPTSDSPRCPRCDGELTYGCVHYAHLGHWACQSCGMARPQAEVRMTKADLTGACSSRLLVATPNTETTLEVPLPGLYNAYNALAAVAAGAGCRLPELSLPAIEQTTAAFFRMEKARVAGHDVYLALAKNANGYTEVLRAVLGDHQPKQMLLGLGDYPDEPPDTSWIWDVDFASLAGLMPAPVISGNRAADLAVRLKYAGWACPGDVSGIAIEPDPERAFQTALARTPAGQPLWIVSTSVVLREVRRWLAHHGHVRQLWREQSGAGAWQA